VLPACRVADLNLGRLAMGLGLLRLPRLPDVRKPSGTELFLPSLVEPESVRYKDKTRERQRQQVGAWLVCWLVGRCAVAGWWMCCRWLR
jgi:hypothetical protein